MNTIADKIEKNFIAILLVIALIGVISVIIHFSIPVQVPIFHENNTINLYVSDSESGITYCGMISDNVFVMSSWGEDQYYYQTSSEEILIDGRKFIVKHVDSKYISLERKIN